MWILFAFLSALFAGLTAILAKCGIRHTNSNDATAIRTCVVLAFTWLMVFILRVDLNFAAISAKSWIFLTLSGLATGASWLCYFRALQLGDVNKVVPVDKSSILLTMIFAFIFLNEPISWIKGAGLVLIGVGTYAMITKRADTTGTRSRAWFVYAALAAIFAALTSILGKVGIEDIDSTLGTALRTCVVLVMAWVVVFCQKERTPLRTIPRREMGFILLSGFATGASWLCYYQALKTGPASVVVPIDKLSLLPTLLFSYLVFKETLSLKGLLGLILITAGTLLMLIK